MEQPNRKKEAHAPGTPTEASGIDSLIAALRSEDGMVREHARTKLVALGRPAATSLIQLLSDDHEQVRWEAAKALSEIRDPSAAEPLVAALEDQRFGTRWVAAEGLIALGRASLLPLLRRLATGEDSTWLREGAHHVFKQLSNKGFFQDVAPVLAALDGFDPSTEVPRAAREALVALEGHMQ